jgi:ketosteroid isomerase-like protein
VTNEDLIRAAYDAWTRRDIEALLEISHEDAEALPILGANIGASVYRGKDGLRDWFRDLTQEWERFETRVTRIDERGDRALCTFNIYARGRASGVVIEGEMYHLIDVRDGLIQRLEAFRDRDDALHALGAT